MRRSPEDVFARLLTESTWRSTVSDMEARLQQLRQEATLVAGALAFEYLADFRRQLADAYRMMSATRHSMEFEMTDFHMWWFAGQTLLSGEKFWTRKRKQTTAPNSQTRPIGIREVPGLLEKLETKINIMSKTVNERSQQ